MKAIMTGVALAALVAGSPALAGGTWQLAQATAPQPAQSDAVQAAPECPEGQTCPEGAPEAGAAPATTGSLPAQPGEAAAAPDEAAPTDMTAEAPAEKFFDEQDDSTVLASELIGQTVYDVADASLGDINDVIWTEEGAIQGVVVGVGGFLGIGEKNVAVNYAALSVTTDEFGNKKFVLDATEDELAAAPEFTTTAQKLAEMRMQQAPAPATGPGGLAPAEPLEPAQSQ
jgi:hypothetical protein